MQATLLNGAVVDVVKIFDDRDYATSRVKISMMERGRTTYEKSGKRHFGKSREMVIGINEIEQFID